MSTDAAPGAAWRTDALRLAAVVSGAAGAAHLSVAPGHFDEYWLFGALFLVAGVLQVAWALAAWPRGDRRRLVLAGVALQLAIAAVWVVSRTAGLPVGPDAGQPESIGPLDAQTTADELLVTALVLVALRERRRMRLLVDALEIAALVAIAATWLMLAAGAEHDH